MTDIRKRILPTVQKPARYTGGEWGEIQKDKTQVNVNLLSIPGPGVPLMLMV